MAESDETSTIVEVTKPAEQHEETTFHWYDAHIEALIRLYEDKPYLYNTTLKEYHDRNRKKGITRNCSETWNNR